MQPDEERVTCQNRVLERAFKDIQPLNSILLSNVRTTVPKIMREQEKPIYDLCKLGKGEVANKDIARVEALARRKSNIITKEMIEKNIQGPSVADSANRLSSLQGSPKNRPEVSEKKSHEE